MYDENQSISLSVYLFVNCEDCVKTPVYHLKPSAYGLLSAHDCSCTSPSFFTLAQFRQLLYMFRHVTNFATWLVDRRGYDLCSNQINRNRNTAELFFTTKTCIEIYPLCSLFCVFLFLTKGRCHAQFYFLSFLLCVRFFDKSSRFSRL